MASCLNTYVSVLLQVWLSKISRQCDAFMFPTALRTLDCVWVNTEYLTAWIRIVVLSDHIIATAQTDCTVAPPIDHTHPPCPSLPPSFCSSAGQWVCHSWFRAYGGLRWEHFVLSRAASRVSPKSKPGHSAPSCCPLHVTNLLFRNPFWFHWQPAWLGFWQVEAFAGCCPCTHEWWYWCFQAGFSLYMFSRAV